MFLIKSSGETPSAHDKEALIFRTLCPLAKVLGLAKLIVLTRRWLIAPPVHSLFGDRTKKHRVRTPIFGEIYPV